MPNEADDTRGWATEVPSNRLAAGRSGSRSRHGPTSREPSLPETVYQARPEGPVMQHTSDGRRWPRLVGGAHETPRPGIGGERHTNLKRRAYLTVLSLTTLLLVGLSVVDGLRTPYWGIAYPVLAIYDGSLLAVLWRRQLPLRAVEALVLGPLVMVLLGFLAAWRVAPDALATEASDLVLVMVWSGLAFPLCFLLFGTRRGSHAALGVYAIFLLLVLPPAVRGGIPSAAAGSLSRSIISLSFFFAVVIALLWVLASRLEELASARAEARLFAAQAVTDPLTGLANRRQLDDELDRQIANARRHPQPLSVVLIDIDRFKAVNDRRGHEAGDQVLIELARRFADSVRATDILGRWGGEEFVLVAPHTDRDAALVLAERCRVAVADAAFLEEVHITASFGVATLVPEDDPRSLLRRADHALYRAKNEGRDRVVGADDHPGPIAVPGAS